MFSKLPPVISVSLFYAFITIMFFMRFFVGNIYGIFLLSLIVYKFSESLLGVTPYGIEGILNWVVLQSEYTKTALLGSFITVIGFMLAYATATANWKSQLLANIKIQAAGEIDSFFSEYAKLATDCKIYAARLIEAVDEIQNDGAEGNAIFLSNYNRDQGQVFIQKRQRLIAMGVDVYSFNARYSTVLITAPGLKSSLNAAIRAVENINDKLWIRVPYHIQGDGDVVQSFVAQIDIAECMELKSAVEDNYDELNYSSGSVRGNLLSTVVGLNGWSMFHIYVDHRNFFKAIKDRYDKLHADD